MSAALDSSPPTVGAELSYSDVAAKRLTVAWGPATDDRSAASELQYKLVRTDGGASLAAASVLTPNEIVMDFTAGVTTAVASGLKPESVYAFLVVVKDAAGNQAFYPTSLKTTGKLQKPGAFTITSATSGDTTIDLTWAPSEDAESYTIKRGTATGVFPDTVATGATSPYTDTGLTNGTAYYYMVTAVNAAGSTDASAEITATPSVGVEPGSPPGAFAITSVSSTNHGVSLSWGPAPGATSYRVTRGTVSGAYPVTASTSATSPFTDTGLDKDTLYFYMVTAANDDGTTDAAAEKSVRTTDAITGWAFVDGSGANGLNRNVGSVAANPHAAVSGDKLYLAWNEKSGAVDQIRVRVYNANDGAPAWAFVDGGGATGLNRNTGKGAVQPTLLDFNAKLYVSWVETNLQAQTRVAVYNGNDGAPAWTFVDGGGADGLNKNVAKVAATPVLQTFAAKLYAMWTETNAVDVAQARIAVYNGNDTAPGWTFVDGNGLNGLNKDPVKRAEAPQISVFSGKLYATWSETGGDDIGQIRVAVYGGDDGAPAWTFVDGNGAVGINRAASGGASFPQLTAFAAKLFATWSENGNTTVAVYGGDDSAPTWTFVDEGGLGSRSGGSSPQLMSFASKLIASWYEFDGATLSYQIGVSLMTGDAASPAWERIGGGASSPINKDPNLDATLPRMAVFGAKLYTVWSENDLNGVRQIRANVGVQ